MNEPMVKVVHAICDQCGIEQHFADNAIPLRALQRDGLMHSDCGGMVRFASEPYVPENDDRHEHEETEPIEKW